MQANCPICSLRERSYLFTVSGNRVFRCAGCGLVRTQAHSALIEPNTYWSGYETEADAGERYAAMVSELAHERGTILIVSSGPHPVGNALARRGFIVSYCAPAAFFRQMSPVDCIVFLYSLENFTDPRHAAAVAHELLTDRGVLFVATPCLDSPAAKFFGRAWIHWDSNSSTYFNRRTLGLLLERCHFQNIWFEPDRRIFGLSHVAERLRQRRLVVIARFLDELDRALPALPPVRLPTSGLVVTALKMPARKPVDLSIIMPVFNEVSTVAATLKSVLDKRIAGVEMKEVILVESNSTDGSREIVKAFQGTPGLKIVLEERPQGKGHAVRCGLTHASGDIILIQDADSEYDIEDYDELLAPLLQWREAFVLGSRHQGDWKMRTFTDNPGLAAVFNFGQIFFTWLMNALYGQKMTDPFTMYKVFRKECLFGLNFECNRFDFDHELVIKLLLKG
jgi:hypothetical protein